MCDHWPIGDHWTVVVKNAQVSFTYQTRKCQKPYQLTSYRRREHRSATLVDLVHLRYIRLLTHLLLFAHIIQLLQPGRLVGPFVVERLGRSVTFLAAALSDRCANCVA
ncbi:unnamed protein product, partial [Nesidiocoris tenuis]